MLEKARKASVSNVSTKNPLDDAKLWGITIWTVDEVNYRNFDRILMFFIVYFFRRCLG